MKTIAEIKQVIDSNRNFLLTQGKEAKKAIKNKATKEIKLYTELLRYLETEPKKEFVVAEIKRLKKLINSKNSQFDNWNDKVCSKDVPVKKRRALFNKENEINKHKVQLKNLGLLLKGKA